MMVAMATIRGIHLVPHIRDRYAAGTRVFSAAMFGDVGPVDAVREALLRLRHEGWLVAKASLRSVAGDELMRIDLDDYREVRASRPWERFLPADADADERTLGSVFLTFEPAEQFHELVAPLPKAPTTYR